MYITKNGKVILSAMVAMFMVFGGMGLFAVSADAEEEDITEGVGFGTLVINFKEYNVNDVPSLTAKWDETDKKWVLDEDEKLPVPENRFEIRNDSVWETYWIFGHTLIMDIEGLMDVVGNIGEIAGTPGGEATEVINISSTQKIAENSEDFMSFYNLGVIDAGVNNANELELKYQLGYQAGQAEVEVDTNEVLYGCLAIIFGVLTFLQFVILLKAFDKGKKDGRKIL